MSQPQVLDPYTPIEVTPLYAADGMQSKGYSVRLDTQDPDEGKRWQECGVVSSSYLLVENAALAGVQDSVVGLAKMPFMESKLFFDGKHFMRSLVTDRLQGEISVGDPVSFGIGVFNSYDGTRAASMFAFLNHLVCSNGMVSPRFLTHFVFRHTDGQSGWTEQIQKAFEILLAHPEQQFNQFLRVLQNLTTQKIDVPSLLDLRTNHFAHLNTAEWGRTVDAFLDGRQYTGMGMLDAFTGRYWHGDNWTQLQSIPRVVNSLAQWAHFSTN